MVQRVLQGMRRLHPQAPQPPAASTPRPPRTPPLAVALPVAPAPLVAPIAEESPDQAPPLVPDTDAPAVTGAEPPALADDEPPPVEPDPPAAEDVSRWQPDAVGVAPPFASLRAEPPAPPSEQDTASWIPLRLAPDDGGSPPAGAHPPDEWLPSRRHPKVATSVSGRRVRAVEAYCAAVCGADVGAEAAAESLDASRANVPGLAAGDDQDGDLELIQITRAVAARHIAEQWGETADLDCIATPRLLAARLSLLIDDEDLQSLEQHISGCERCREVQDRLIDAERIWDETLGTPPVAASAAVAAPAAATASAAGSLRGRRKRRLALLLVPALVAGIVVATVLASGSGHSSSTPASAPAIATIAQPTPSTPTIAAHAEKTPATHKPKRKTRPQQRAATQTTAAITTTPSAAIPTTTATPVPPPPPGQVPSQPQPSQPQPSQPQPSQPQPAPTSPHHLVQVGGSGLGPTGGHQQGISPGGGKH